jgi:hypothetical protein
MRRWFRLADALSEKLQSVSVIESIASCVRANLCEFSMNFTASLCHETLNRRRIFAVPSPSRAPQSQGY